VQRKKGDRLHRAKESGARLLVRAGHPTLKHLHNLGFGKTKGKFQIKYERKVGKIYALPFYQSYWRKMLLSASI